MSRPNPATSDPRDRLGGLDARRPRARGGHGDTAAFGGAGPMRRRMKYCWAIIERFVVIQYTSRPGRVPEHEEHDDEWQGERHEALVAIGRLDISVETICEPM